ncbi:hypothetical protein [Streptomyces sp. NPDC059003]
MADWIKGFTPELKRWVVEQTLGALMLHTRDHETRTASSAAWIH